MASSPIDFRDREIASEVLEFRRAAGQEDDSLFRCSLRDCKLILEEPCGAYFLDCTFNGCNVIAKKECKQPWNGCRWVNCTFFGDYVLVLGRRDECQLPPGPMIVGCDFSQATLHGTYFRNADVPSIKFPRWPNVTILEPSLHRAELRSLKFSPMVQIWWDGYSSSIGQSIDSMTFNWAQIVKEGSESKFVKWDFDQREVEVRSTLARLPYVIM